MARPLRELPPTSAVARLLDVGAATRATASAAVSAPESTNVQSPPVTRVQSDSCRVEGNALIKREFVLTPVTERVLTTLIDSIREATGARVSASHVLRALLLAVEHAQGTIDSEARRVGPLRLPSNARGRNAERAEFERRIAAALAAGMRAAAAFDSSV